MKIRIISDIVSFKLLLNDWNELFSLGSYSMFQSFDFNYYSWEVELSKNPCNKLCIVLLEKNKEIDAIFPLYIDSQYTLRFINDRHADFCDCISRKHVDFMELYDYLKSEVNFYSIRLINLLRDSNIYNNIICLDKLNKSVKIGSEYSVLDIEKGKFPYNVNQYRSHQKHRINKASRKYKNSISLVLNYKESPFPKRELFCLRDEMILLGLREYDFLTNDRLYLIERLYNSGILILHFMKEKEKINSCNIIMKRSDNEFMFWIDLFDNSKMINIASYIRFIETVSLESSVVMNFGRGRYFYKVSNFSPVFDSLYQIDVYDSRFVKLIFCTINYIRNSLISTYKNIKR